MPGPTHTPESGEDFLLALQHELALRDIKSEVTLHGTCPQLRIHGPDDASAAPADPDRSVIASWRGDAWWFAWPWPERISRVADVTGAAKKIMTAIGRDHERRTRPVQPWIIAVDGQKLRELRRQRGLSQERLADHAGISLATVARLERQFLPTCRARTLARLAAALDELPATIIALTQPEQERSANRPESWADTPRLAEAASAHSDAARARAINPDSRSADAVIT